MHLFIIAVETPDHNRTERILDDVCRNGGLGYPCRNMSNARVIRSERTQEEIGAVLEKYFTEPEDRFMVATLFGSWFAHNCPTLALCFD